MFQRVHRFDGEGTQDSPAAATKVLPAARRSVPVSVRQQEPSDAQFENSVKVLQGQVWVSVMSKRQRELTRRVKSRDPRGDTPQSASKPQVLCLGSSSELTRCSDGIPTRIQFQHEDTFWMGDPRDGRQSVERPDKPRTSFARSSLSERSNGPTVRLTSGREAERSSWICASYKNVGGVRRPMNVASSNPVHKCVVGTFWSCLQID